MRKYMLLLFLILLSTDISLGKVNKIKASKLVHNNNNNQVKPDSKGHSDRTKRAIDDDDNPFWPNRGKKELNGLSDSDEEPTFWAHRGRRESESTENFIDVQKAAKSYVSKTDRSANCENCDLASSSDEVYGSVKNARDDLVTPFWGNRGRRNSEELADNILPESLNWGGRKSEDGPFFGNTGRKMQDGPFWGNRGRRMEDGPFWGNRGRRTEDGPFWGNRGRRDDVEGPFWGNRGRREDSGRRMKDDGPFFGIRGRRMEDGPFFGNRGRKVEDDGPFFGNRGRRIEDGLFFGNRGRKVEDDGPFFGNRGRRMEDGPFFGNRGRKVEDGPFWGNRGRRMEDGPFWGNRGRRTEDGPFWGNRGRRDDVEGPFWGNRGRREDSSRSMEDDGPFFGNRGRRMEDGPFWGNRGRRQDDEPFWGNRGRRDDEDGPFWGNRGRREELGPFWGNRGRRKESESSLSSSGRRKEDLKESILDAINSVENDIENLSRLKKRDDTGSSFWANRSRESKLKHLFDGPARSKLPKSISNKPNFYGKSEPGTVHDSRIYADEPHYIIVERNSRSSAEDDPFYISRGKKYFLDLAKAARDRRGAIEDLVKSVRNDPYYIARGKKDDFVKIGNTTMLRDEFVKAKDLICATIDMIMTKNGNNNTKRDINDSERDRRTILKKLAAQLQMDPYFVSRGKKSDDFSGNKDNLLDFISDVAGKCN